MSENSRELRLARSRLRAATRLRNAANRTCMSEVDREDCVRLASILELYEKHVYKTAARADAHLEAMVRSRRK